MATVIAFCTHFTAWQWFLAVLSFAFFVGAIVAAFIFVGVLVREHFKTWRKRSAYRRVPVALY